MEEIFNQIRQILLPAKRIILTTHADPDGDALGSLTALYKVLRRDFGKEVVMVATGKVPEGLNFLPFFFKIRDGFDPEPDDVAIILDCGGWKRTGLFEEDELIIDWPQALVVIDHHAAQSLTPGIHFVDSNASSTAELVMRLIKHWAIQIDSDIGTSLLTGLIYDTGAFRHVNTTAETYAAAGELALAGADRERIIRTLFMNKSISQLKLWGKILSSMRYDEKRMITTAYVTQADLVELGLTENALSGIANLMNTIPGLKFSLLLTEQEDSSVRGSFRTEHETVDVSKLARLMGGGGHKKAAGFTMGKD